MTILPRTNLAAVERGCKRPLRVLSVSSLFPNAAQPQHGVFLEHRLKHLAASGDVELAVIAPVPWFPSVHRAFGRYGAYAAAPKKAQRAGLSVFHPRFPAIPKVSADLAGILMALAIAPTLSKLIRRGFEVDVIDGYYLYPDGVACAHLAQWFGLPLVLTALGCDVSLIPKARLPRAQILWAARRAHGLTAVCDALRVAMEALGIAQGRVQVVPHGVDLALFSPPADREATRMRLGMQGTTLLSAGSLIPRKGHDIAISALQRLPGVRLLIAGGGPLAKRLEAQAQAQLVSDRVTFLGEIPQERLAEAMGSADALVLCSEREGIANVLIEALACGTPAVATPVWGTPEVMDAPCAGVLLRERSPEALVEGVRALLAAPPDRAAVREHAARFSWSATAARHAAILRDAAASRHRVAENSINARSGSFHASSHRA